MHTTTRRAVIAALSAAALVFGATATATAKKPRPPEPTQYYEVTLTGDLSTSAGCTLNTTLTMREQDGHLVADGAFGTSTPRLGFEAAVPWTRELPTPAGDPSGFHGCHGGSWPDAGGESVGYLWIYRDGESIAGLMWAFDWYTGEVPGPGRKPKPQKVQEYFRTWNAEPLTLGGPTTFVVTYYGPSGITELGATDLTLDIAVEPLTG